MNNTLSIDWSITMCEISVIIPVYNVEPYLERCLNSVLGQTFTDFEVILIDDGSTDNSGLICDKYVEKHSFIKVLHIENSGPAKARRIGVDNSNGKYIMFMDSDDYIAVDMLQELYSSSRDADIVCSNCYRVIGDKLELQPFYKQDFICFSSPHEILYEFFTKRYINGAVWGKIIKRELLYNIDFCERAIIGEDINIMLQLYEKSKEVRCISRPLYFYVQNLDGISHSGYTGKHCGGLECYIKTRKGIVTKYPGLRIEATGYFLEYEMAAITAMCRNKTYNTLVIEKLQKDLKENMWQLLRNKYSAIYMKICALMIVICPNVFIIIFRIIHVITGR